MLLCIWQLNGLLSIHTSLSSSSGLFSTRPHRLRRFQNSRGPELQPGLLSALWEAEPTTDSSFRGRQALNRLWNKRKIINYIRFFRGSLIRICKSQCDSSGKIKDKKVMRKVLSMVQYAAYSCPETRLYSVDRHHRGYVSSKLKRLYLVVIWNSSESCDQSRPMLICDSLVSVGHGSCNQGNDQDHHCHGYSARRGQTGTCHQKTQTIIHVKQLNITSYYNILIILLPITIGVGLIDPGSRRGRCAEQTSYSTYPRSR